MTNDALLTALAAYDTPTICNVIELFEVRPRHTGYVRDARIRANFPALPPVVGYAATDLSAAGQGHGVSVARGTGQTL